MKDHYDFTNARKNPYAEKIKKHGYIIRVQCDPDDEYVDDSTSDEIEATDAYAASKPA